MESGKGDELKVDMEEKLEILSDAAKYDAACTSSGVSRSAKKLGVGNATCAGICHSFAADGRCISLLKILLSNECVYDCAYCVNRISNDVKRASFTAKEVADLTMNFYIRNYIEGLFLSSAVVKNPDHTMELMCRALELLRFKYNFNGYIHAKVIPGASEVLVERLGFLADRLSVNIELPSEQSLKLLAPQKSRKAIFKPMGQVTTSIAAAKGRQLSPYRGRARFSPAGQSTQMIIGASGESDYQILRLTKGMYNKFSLKRVFYSAYVPVNTGKNLPAVSPPPLLREHRLYQADWLMRFYGFDAEEILTPEEQNFNLFLDPKCAWAMRNLDLFPIEINRADHAMLLRVPGIGVQSAFRICRARKVRSLKFEDLKKMGIVIKRAQYFILCEGKYKENLVFKKEFILANLLADSMKNMPKTHVQYEQLPLFEKEEERVYEPYLRV